MTPHLLLDGYWELWVTKFFLKILQERMTVVEVGANIGYYTILAASRVGVHGKVHAFEANPEVFDILYRNIEVNGFRDRVTLVNKAVIDKSGILQFHCPQYHQAGGSIVPFSEKLLKEIREERETIKVETISLDEYFEHHDGKIDIVKIDAEGSEPFIFKGMKKVLTSNRDIKIVCEFTPPCYIEQGLDPGEFLNEIIKQGFKIKLINLQSKLENISPERLLEIPYSELFIER
ncbi:MAG: FkbM family methyltransferase [Promethearchaeota archaeon]